MSAITVKGFAKKCGASISTMHCRLYRARRRGDCPLILYTKRNCKNVPVHYYEESELLKLTTRKKGRPVRGQ